MANPYSRYFIPAGTRAKAHGGDDSSRIRTLNTSFSDEFCFKRVGAHHLVLPPGARTSLPHAESLEEEFVFVAQGNPHAWIDGFVYELKPNCAAGFPSRTGIAHCFINNTQLPVELLVFGERTKKENLCAFPINPEEKETCKIWWADAPKRALGPHNGLPGPIMPEALGKAWPSCLIDCETLQFSTGWHYAGDSETFGEYARITDSLGLNFLGIGFETLPPGKRSAFPHAHKLEEEFLYMLEGTGQVWMNGFLTDVAPGTGVGFVPGTNISHVIINDTNETLKYLVVGEAPQGENEDRIYYPMHQFRNENCSYRGDLWVDRPTNIEMGDHDGRPRTGLVDHLAFELFEEVAADRVLEIFQRSPDYFSKVDGCLPSMRTVHQETRDIPEVTSSTYKKEFLILKLCDQSVGVVDLHVNHPEPGVAYIGLLLLAEDQFGKNLGTRFYELVEHYCKTTFKTRLIKLAVSDEKDVSPFWKKLGFTANDKTFTWEGENKSSLAKEFEKPI